MKISNVKNSIFLFLAAFIWGIAFVFQSKGNDYMQPFTFSAARNFLGFLVLTPVVLFKIRNSHKDTSNTKIPLKITIVGGIFCGLALTAASLFQQYGVKYTSVGKAGFITTLYIIITPILGMFLKRKCSWTVWVGAIVSVFGMYLLCVTDNFSISAGDILVFICAILFAIHILIVDHFAPMTDGVVLSCQILGQKNFNPTASAMILSLESVISAISSYIAYSVGFLSQDQTLTMVQIVGCAIVFGAVIFVQIPVDKLKRHH